MTTLDDLPFHDGQESPPTGNGAQGTKPCSHHHLNRRFVITDATTHPVSGYSECGRCHARLDPVKARRGKSSDRLGKDNERRIERVYGPRKVGEYGDAVDHLGRDFKWQAKATRSDPPLWLAATSEPTWLARLPMSVIRPMAHMTGIGGTLRPLVIRSYVRQGVATRDWLFVIWADWYRLHGGEPWPVGYSSTWEPTGFGYVVIPGASFLAIHGRDVP